MCSSSQYWEGTATTKRTMTLVIAAAVLWCGLVPAAQSPVRGTITGKVTADQGQLRGIRVAAHNLDRRIW